MPNDGLSSSRKKPDINSFIKNYIIILELFFIIYKYVSLYFDGASRGNPGPASLGELFMILKKKKK